MNEYRGFKVGDRVEVKFANTPVIKGVITSFGDRRMGGFAEPDTMDVWISETTRYDMIYLVSHDLIKKLHKYAVGDVVRCNSRPPYNYEIASVVGLSDNTIGYTLSDCGSVKFSEPMLIPFDGFRVGDTVFTVKRGKGKIVADRESMPRRFKVVFDADKDHPTIICRHPKLTNLIPTEAKYKEALNKAGYAFKIDVAVVEEYDPKDSVAKHFEKIEKAAQAMNLIHSAAKIWANAFGRTTDQIKFPSGGVVHQCPPRYGFYKDGLPIDPICVIKSWQPPAPNPYFGQVQVAPSFSKKPTYTRSAEGKLEVVDGGVEKKYRCSKFAVHELVSYAGCIRAVVDKIHYKDGKFTYDLRTNSCSEGLPEDSLSAVVAHSAKFKVGDSVYYRGLRLIIESIWISIDNVPVYLIRPNGYACSVQESDLRLWKETVLTHCLQSDGKTWSDGGSHGWKKEWYKNIEVLYSGGEYDVFLVGSMRGNRCIFRGKKGDDIS